MQVYVPTNDSRGELKEHFYNELQKVTEQVFRVKKLMGRWGTPDSNYLLAIST